MTNDERARLDVIEAKVDTLLVKFQYVEATVKDHENRVRNVEKWKMAIPASLIMALTAGIGFILRSVLG